MFRKLILTIMLLIYVTTSFAQNPPGEQGFAKVRFTDEVRFLNRTTDNTTVKILTINADNQVRVRNYSTMGNVRSVNNVTPDVNGNVEITLPNNTSIYKETFTASGSNDFTLTFEPTNTISVYRNGQALINDQFFITGNTLTLQEDISIGDKVLIVYTQTLSDTSSYTKAETDALLSTSGGVFVASIIPTSPSPSQTGIFTPTQTGTYTNFGNISVDLSEGVTLITYDGVNYNKQVVPIELSEYATNDSVELAREVSDTFFQLSDLVIAKSFNDGILPPSNQDSTSTFSGWETSVGTPSDFNKIRFKVTTRSNAVTELWVRLTDYDANTVLFEKHLTDISLAPNTTHELTIDLETTIANSLSHKLTFAFLANQFITRWGITDPSIYPSPYPAVKYQTNGTLNFSTMFTVGGGTPGARVTFVEFLKTNVDTSQELVDNLNNKLLPNCDILLPSMVYIVESIQTNIYFDNILYSDISLSELEIDITCPIGTQYERFYRVTPVLANVGTHTFTISVKYKGIIINSKTVTLVCKAMIAGSSQALDVIAIGDSTTGGGEYISTINTDYDGLNSPDLTFMGTRGTNPNKNEGRGGWTFSLYTGPGLTYYKFNVTGVTTPPGVSSVYSHNGSQYQIQEINMTSGTGYFSGNRILGSNDPTATGVLTKVSGTGDTSISFSSFETVPGNPFWNTTTSELDFANYLTVNSFSLTSSDLITIHLGINDIFNLTPGNLTTGINNIKNNIDILIANIRDAVPGINIGLCLTIPPTISQDGFGANYGTGQTLKGYYNNYVALMKMMLSEYDTESKRTEKTFVTGFSYSIDRTYNFLKTTTAVNSRNSETYTTYTNGVHPATTGYGQMGDALYCFIKSLY